MKGLVMGSPSTRGRCERPRAGPRKVAIMKTFKPAIRDLWCGFWEDFFSRCEDGACLLLDRVYRLADAHGHSRPPMFRRARLELEWLEGRVMPDATGVIGHWIWQDL